MNKELISAVEAIKTAILQSQYQAAKDVNRVQLILYFCIGRFLSSKKGKKTWGTGVLETISAQLRKELPGLRGFSAESLKKMRQFYENWAFLEDSNSTVITDETPVTAEKSVITTTDFMKKDPLNASVNIGAQNAPDSLNSNPAHSPLNLSGNCRRMRAGTVINRR